MAFLSKIWSYTSSTAGEALGIGAIIISFLALVRKSGADAVKVTQDQQTLKDIGVKNEIEQNNSNVDAVSELRDKWSK